MRHKQQQAEANAKKKADRINEMKRQAAEAAAEAEASEKGTHGNLEALTDPCGWIHRIQCAQGHYMVLDLPRSCGCATVRVRYLQLARLLHPDKCTEEAATEAFQKVLPSLSQIFV